MNDNWRGGKTRYHRVLQQSVDLAQYVVQLLTCGGRALVMNSLLMWHWTGPFQRAWVKFSAADQSRLRNDKRSWGIF